MTFVKFTSVLFALVLVPSAAHAQTGQCPTYTEPDIVITPAFAPFEIDHEADAKKIVELRIKNNIGQEQDIPAGLTSFSFSLRGDGHNQMFEKADGDVCAQVSKYNLSMSVTKTIVYLASELPKDSCEYNAILDHEYKHIDAVKAVLRDVLPLTERHIREYLRHLGMVRAPTAAEAEARINTIFGAYVTELNKSLLEVSDKMGRSVDTPEERANLEKACGGNLSKTINDAVK